MATSDVSVFAWAMGKAALIVISCFGAVVCLAWVGAKRSLTKR
jgi:hypothetical protein